MEASSLARFDKRALPYSNLHACRKGAKALHCALLQYFAKKTLYMGAFVAPD